MGSVSFPLFFDSYLVVMKDYLNQLALELNREPPLLSKAWDNLVCSFDNENLKSKRIFELVGDFACKSSIKLSELHTSMKCASQASIEAERRFAEREISRLESLLKEANEKNSLLMSEKDYLALEIARLQERFSSERDLFNSTIIEARDQLLRLESEKMNIEKEKIDLDLFLSETNTKMSTLNAEMENLKSTMEYLKLQETNTEMNITSLSNTALEFNSNLSPPVDASPATDSCPFIETSPSSSIHTPPSSIHTPSVNFIGSAIDSTLATYSTPVMYTSAVDIVSIPTIGSIPSTVSSSVYTTISDPSSEIRVSPSIAASPFTSDSSLIEDSPAVNIPPSLDIHLSPIPNSLAFETAPSVSLSSSSPSSSIANSASLSTNFVLLALAVPLAAIANDSILLTAATPNSTSNSAAMDDSFTNSINLNGSVSPSNDAFLTSNDAVSTPSHSNAVTTYASITEHAESDVSSSNSAQQLPNFARVPARLKFLFGSDHGSSLVNEFFPHLN